MDGDVSRRLVASLVHGLGPDADAAHIAEAMVSIWQGVDAVLCPIIGPAGLAALQARCLNLTALAHPWLDAAGGVALNIMDMAAFGSLVAQQNRVEASAACIAFVRKVYELLDRMVGSSLTDHLLGPIWAHSLGGNPAQDDTLP